MRYWDIKRYANCTSISFIGLLNVESIDIHEGDEGIKCTVNEASRLQDSLTLSKEAMVEALQEAIILIKNDGKLEDYGSMSYLIGQRVILNSKEIGTVVKPEHSNCDEVTSIWVFSPSKNYASCYDKCNVKPLPNDQL